MTVGELLGIFTMSTKVEVFDLESECPLYEGNNGFRLGSDIEALDVDSAWVHDDTLHVDVIVDTEGRE